jgi:diaminopimelate epimerase
MMAGVEFTKGHGTGNDFVLLADPDGQLPLTPDLVGALCDRRRGIGADGVLRVVRSAKHPAAVDLAAAAEWFMDYWNADGSLAEMCGNGVRVFTRYLVTHGLAESPVPVATRAGVVRAVVDGDTIAVDMGTPKVYAASTATLGSYTLPGTAVDCGNPHLVCALPSSVPLGSLDLTVAPSYDAAVFPAGVNVEFVTPGSPVAGADLHVHMRVHERGSAETLSCGSGALAVGYLALQDSGLSTGSVAVDVPGGRLTVTVEEDTAWLSGPAVLVATGTVDPAAIQP